MEGIAANIGEEALLARDSKEFIAIVTTLLQHPRNNIGQAARARVIADYTWERNLERVDELLSPEIALHNTVSASQPFTLDTAGVTNE